jgi:PadR family transcriptional regulator, regulatory protein AphA
MGKAKRPKTKYALLGLLSIESMSGYDIRKTIEQSISHFWQEGYGQIYPTLKELTEDGLATLEVQQQAGKPNRQVYSLTDKGRGELKVWLLEPVSEWSPTRNELLLKLFFGRHSRRDTVIGQVRQYRGLLESRLAIFEAIELQLTGEPDPHGDKPYWIITLRHGLYACRAGVAWCDETLSTLQEIGGPEPSSTGQKNL